MPPKKFSTTYPIVQKKCLALAIKAIGMSGGLTLRAIPTHLTKALWRHVLFQLFHQAGTAKQMTKSVKIQEFPLSQKLHVICGFIKTSKSENRTLHHNQRKRKRKPLTKKQQTTSDVNPYDFLAQSLSGLTKSLWGYIEQKGVIIPWSIYSTP